MPTIPLHLAKRPTVPPENPLPALLQTPSGLAIIEIQGTIHFPASSDELSFTEVGKLVFPLHNSELNDPSDTKWMKRVYFYVGQNQRMTGEVKKLSKPFAVIRKKESGLDDMEVDVVPKGDSGSAQEELEIAEVVRYKIVFSARPEPVGGNISGVAE